MPPDLTRYIDAAFAHVPVRGAGWKPERKPEPQGRPFCIRGGFREGSDMFMGLHPNKRVVEKPMAGMHTHDYLEIVYVHKGCLHQRVGDRYVKSTEGDIMLLNAHAAHQPWVETADDIVINLGIREDAVRRILSPFRGREDGAMRYAMTSLFSERPGARKPALWINGTPDIRALLTEMFCEYFRKDSLYEQVLLADFVRLMVALVRSLDARPEALPEGDPDEVAASIQAYIQENYTSITMDSLCQRFRYSERHMRRLLRAFSDDPLPDMVNRIKIEKACEYIDQTNMPTEDVIFRVGFNNASYFYRTFKNMKGVNLSDYRQMKHSIPCN